MSSIFTSASVHDSHVAIPLAQMSAGRVTNKSIAQGLGEYMKDTVVSDVTRLRTPANLRVTGNELTWDAEADVESVLAHFIIERDGRFLATVPERGPNSFGRPIFQNLQYSDTPTQPLVPMRFIDTTADAGNTHRYRVIAVNTAGLKSKQSPGEVELDALPCLVP